MAVGSKIRITTVRVSDHYHARHPKLYRYGAEHKKPVRFDWWRVVLKLSPE